MYQIGFGYDSHKSREEWDIKVEGKYSNWSLMYGIECGTQIESRHVILVSVCNTDFLLTHTIL